MLYVKDIKDNKIGIRDTNTGKTDYLTDSELQKLCKSKRIHGLIHENKHWRVNNNFQISNFIKEFEIWFAKVVLMNRDSNFNEDIKEIARKHGYNYVDSYDAYSKIAIALNQNIMIIINVRNRTYIYEDNFNLINHRIENLKDFNYFTWNYVYFFMNNKRIYLDEIVSMFNKLCDYTGTLYALSYIGVVPSSRSLIFLLTDDSDEYAEDYTRYICKINLGHEDGKYDVPFMSKDYINNMRGNLKISSVQVLRCFTYSSMINSGYSSECEMIYDVMDEYKNQGDSIITVYTELE